ncbi:CHAP domain-containing protein [Gordonia alkaliphila]
MTTALCALVVAGGSVLAAGEAAAASGRVITGSGYTLKIRSAPNASAPIVGELRNGNQITIECQTNGSAVRGDYGTTTLWDRIPGRGYVSDAWIYTGTNGRVAGECGGAPAPAAPSSGRAKGLTVQGHNPFNTADLRGYCTYGAQEMIRRAAGYYIGALRGNAGQWADQARAARWTVVSSPQPRSVVVYPSSIVGGVGHVAWVDAVKGNTLTITDMNGGTGGATYPYKTSKFGVFDTRPSQHRPGMQYILIP